MKMYLEQFLILRHVEWKQKAQALHKLNNDPWQAVTRGTECSRSAEEDTVALVRSLARGQGSRPVSKSEHRSQGNTGETISGGRTVLQTSLSGVDENRGAGAGNKWEMWTEAREWKETKALGLYPGGNEEIMKIFN